MNPMVSALRTYPWHDRRAYADYLVQTHGYASHSVPLLNHARNFLGAEDHELRERFKVHGTEETGHEELARGDVKALGFSVTDFTERPETRALWQPQYAWGEEDGATLLGYIVALERCAAEVCSHLFRVVSTAHGPKAARFLEVHAEVDCGHAEIAQAQIDTLADARRRRAEQNARDTEAAYVAMIQALKRDHGEAR